MQNVGIVAEKHVGIVEQVVEIHGSGHMAAVDVGAVDFGHALAACPAVAVAYVAVGGVGVRAYQGVLGRGNEALHSGRLIYLFVEFHVADYHLDKVARVVGVVDGEI